MTWGLLADATTTSLFASMAVMGLSLAAIWVTVLNNRAANRRLDETNRRVAEKTDRDYTSYQDAEIEDLRRDLKECKDKGSALQTALDISDEKYIRLLKRFDDAQDDQRRSGG